MWSIAQRAKRHSSPFKRRGVGQAKDRRSTRGPARPDARRSTGGSASPGARQTSSDPKPDTTPLPLIWDVRIANLRQIDYPTLQPVAKSAFPELLSVRVDYVGNYLPIFLLVFIAYLSTYVYYLSEQGYLSSRFVGVACVVVAALFGLFATDVTVTYLTGPFDKINHALNAPILICNFLLLCWIAFKMRQKISS